MTELQTERLLLRQWRADDFEPLAATYADPAAARFIGGVNDADKSWRRLAAVIGHWALRGYGPWAVEERASGEFAGCVGLWHSAGWPEIELGYWLVPSRHGKGYATEAGTRARDWAFAELGLDTLVSYIDPRNTPSIRVAERLGARHDGSLELLEFGSHDVYRYPKP